MTASLTPSIKGQLTKAMNTMRDSNACPATFHATIIGIFKRHMPRQQAKHATRKYLAAQKGGAK